MPVTKNHAILEEFNLLKVAVPLQFSNSIEQTEIAKQEIGAAKNELSERVQFAKNIVDQARIDAQIKIFEANNTARGYLKQIEADVNALKVQHHLWHCVVYPPPMTYRRCNEHETERIAYD